MKNRMRGIRTSGSVGDGDGNIPIYPAMTPNRSLFEFNPEAWVRLDVINDLVIASHKIGDGDPTSVGANFPSS